MSDLNLTMQGYLKSRGSNAKAIREIYENQLIPLQNLVAILERLAHEALEQSNAEPNHLILFVVGEIKYRLENLEVLLDEAAVRAKPEPEPCPKLAE